MAGKIEINRITNANIYVNGNSLLGRADYEWNGGRTKLAVAPFARRDSADEERTHADMREFGKTEIDVNSGLASVGGNNAAASNGSSSRITTESSNGFWTTLQKNIEEMLRDKEKIVVTTQNGLPAMPRPAGSKPATGSGGSMPYSPVRVSTSDGLIGAASTLTRAWPAASGGSSSLTASITSCGTFPRCWYSALSMAVLHRLRALSLAARGCHRMNRPAYPRVIAPRMAQHLCLAH